MLGVRLGDSMKKRFFVPVFLILTVFMPRPVLADSKLAFSVPKKVEFVAIGAPWCKADIQLEIRLKDSASPLTNKAARLAFLPRLQPVIEKKCPKAKRLQAKVIGPNGRVLPGSGIIKASRENGWLASESAPVRTAAKLRAKNRAPFKSSRELSSEGLMLAILNFQPQYKDSAKFPGIINSLASVYACDQLRLAQYNEFMQQTLNRAMKAKLLSLSRRAGAIKAKPFKLSFEITLDSYDFDRSGFAHSAFDKSIAIKGLLAQSGCRSNMENSFPWNYNIKVKGGEDIKFQPVNDLVAKAYVGRMQQKNNGNRTVIVELVYTIAGIVIKGKTGQILAEPVAVRFLDPINKRELGRLDGAGIAKLKEDEKKAIARAKAERLERERQQKIESQKQKLASMLDDFREFFDSEKRRPQRIAHAMGIHTVGESIHDNEFPNPAVAASISRFNGEATKGYVIFKAEGEGKEKVKAAWPAGLRVTLKGKASAPLKREGWYVAYGTLSYDKSADEGSPVLPAILKTSWVYACTDTACAEADNVELMLEAVSKRLKASFEKADGGE
jgi:hypothetical protein